jgi:hypothetical protein
MTFCTCDRRGGLLCWSLRQRHLVVHPPSHVRYWQHRCVPSSPEAFSSLANSGTSRPSAPDCIDFGIDPLFDCLDASPSSSMVASPPRHCPHDASRASAASCVAPYPRQSRQPHVDHGYPTHDIFDHGYSPSSSVASTSTQRATIRMSYSPVFSPVAVSAPHRRSNCGGMSVRRLLLSASSPVSPSAVLPL